MKLTYLNKLKKIFFQYIFHAYSISRDPSSA